jgi:hypothetical protein
VVQIRLALESALPEYIPALPFEYQPHVSIGFFPDLESLQLAQEKVKSELRAPIVFQVDALSYGFQGPDNRWIGYDRIML